MDKPLKVAGIIILCLLGIPLVLGIIRGLEASHTPQGVGAQEIIHGFSRSNDDVIVTMAAFNRVHDGMSYQQVVQIIGQAGTEVSSNVLPTGTGRQLRTIVYEWRNPDFSGMNAIFQNDRLMQKSQFMLK